ncbi:lipocalin family protein [uncultured Microscilla sp.]|uniref:lipocalin family protein n=1 Tax=uncultured Microscilla sp. TaxID=432653 RepID=UPI00261F8CD3|nr:lipocalin family protein [uncultured Microscilla sp.]
MKFLNGLLIIAVFAFVTACGGGANTGNTEGDTTSTAETKKDGESTEVNKEDETKKEDQNAPKVLLVAQKWGYDVDASVGMLSEEDQKKISEEQKKAMKGMSMEFKADGTYEMALNGEAKEKGTWTMSEDGKTITTKEEGKDKEVIANLKEMTAEKMVIEMKDGEKTETFVMVKFVAPVKEEVNAEGNKEETKKEEVKTEEKK